MDGIVPTDNGRITLALLGQKVDANQTEVMRRLDTLERLLTQSQKDHEERLRCVEKKNTELDGTARRNIERIDDLETDVEGLKKNNYLWNGFNTVGLGIAAIVAWLRGG